MITNSILSELAFVLTDHEASQSGSAHFVDLTTGGLTFIMADYMFEEGEITDGKIILRNTTEPAASR